MPTEFVLPYPLKQLRERLLSAEARMLEIRRNPALHGELKEQQKAMQKARAELKAYESLHP